MKTMEMVLKDELFQLKQLTESAKKRLETAPKGGLRITKKQNRVEYYYKESRRDVGEREKDRKEKRVRGNGRYMRKREISLVKRHNGTMMYLLLRRHRNE